jgi:hypothetical protein
MGIAAPLRILALGLSGSLLVAQSTAIANEWPRVTVCELLRAPEQYVGKNVEVAGQTEGHWFESAPLRDKRCRDAGAVELAGEASSGLDELRRASAAADRAGNALPGVATVLRGRFEHRPDGLPRYILVVLKVVSIQNDGVPTAVPPIPPKRGPDRKLERE